MHFTSKFLAILLLALTAAFGTGCHTVTKANMGFKRPIALDSRPQGAQVQTADGQFIGETPCTFRASPRTPTTLIFTYPGHAPRQVVIRAEHWAQGSGIETGGNLAAGFISPPVGLGALIVDHWGTRMDRDFVPILIELYPAPQQVAVAAPNTHQGQVPCPPEDDQSWRPRIPSAVPWLDRQGQPLSQAPRQGLTHIPGFVPQCCEPAKSVEQLERERRTTLGQSR